MTPDDLVARHFASGEWVRISLDGASISAVERTSETARHHTSDEWVAPAFWDIQTNGRWGISFSDRDLTSGQVVQVVRAQAALGTARICPTLITAPLDDMRRALRAIASACVADPQVASRVLGIHLEGPFISELDGYRGAHPLAAVCDPDWEVFQEFQADCGGRIVLITLAPERPGALEFIRKAVSQGVVVALGHTAADGPTLRAAAEAGARLSTHLGNGIAATLPRHPNPIWEQAALDTLSASLIADGHHLDAAVLRVLVRAKGLSHTILVSDASPLAGLPPGRYGDWAVDPSGKIVVAGTPYLAGSNQGLELGLNKLIDAAGLALADALATVTRNPARLLNRPEPSLEAGQPANLVVFAFRRERPQARFELLRTCVDGEWTDIRTDATEGAHPP